MKKTVRARELPPSRLRWRCAPGLFDFKTTDDIKPCQDIIGQDRALSAIKMGLKLEHRGYNIFITGLVGTGRTTTIKHLLERLEKKGPIPSDICYMNNFKNPNMPRMIELEAGKGNELSADMNRLIAELLSKISSVFQSDYYKDRRKKLVEEFQVKQKDIVSKFEKDIASEGFTMVRMQVGPVIKPELLPVVDGNPVNFPQLQKLAEEGKMPKENIKKYEESAEKLSERMQVVYSQVKDLERAANKRLEQLDFDTVSPVIHDLIEEIARKYGNEALSKELDEVEEALMQKLDLFRPSDEDGPPQQSAAAADPGEREDPFREFRVNVVVDNSETKAPPVIIENFPNFRNLFGAIERDIVFGGVTKTDHLNIRAGSFHRANGGYLVLNALDVLTEPGVWQSLKRTLKSSEALIQSYDPWSLMGSSTMKPEAMKLKVKIVLIGDDYIYYLLYSLDEDFQKIFKIKAEFDREMKNSTGVIRQYVRFIKKICVKEHLKPFDRSGSPRSSSTACGSPAARRSSRRASTSSPTSSANRLLGAQGGERTVGRRRRREGHQERFERVSLIEDKIQEMIDEGTHPDRHRGRRRRPGQRPVRLRHGPVHVRQAGPHHRPDGHRPGRRHQHRARSRHERAHAQQGRPHPRRLPARERYAQQAADRPDRPLAFEQSYGGVDGDSASSTEVYAILSSLVGLPLRQDLAVTGSLNQKGEIQPIGGVNEKIEGFFGVCRARGLTGTRGRHHPPPERPEPHARPKRSSARSRRRNSTSIRCARSTRGSRS